MNDGGVSGVWQTPHDEWVELLGQLSDEEMHLTRLDLEEAMREITEDDTVPL